MVDCDDCPDQYVYDDIYDASYDEVNCDGYIIRTFDESLHPVSLKWHYDDEDRLISATHDNDWQFQFDNELPVHLNKGECIFIKSGHYHRLIKGSGSLSIKIVKVDSGQK